MKTLKMVYIKKKTKKETKTIKKSIWYTSKEKTRNHMTITLLDGKTR